MSQSDRIITGKVGYNAWIGNKCIDYALKEFEGKKVYITIEVID